MYELKKKFDSKRINENNLHSLYPQTSNFVCLGRCYNESSSRTIPGVYDCVIPAGYKISFYDVLYNLHLGLGIY